MLRLDFLKKALGASILIGVDGFASITNGLVAQHNEMDNTTEIADFGAVHLNNTSIEKAIGFWTKIAGLKLRSATAGMAEFGTEETTLVVVHQSAETGFKGGFSGLYHFAIHAPNEQEFARMLYRILANKYPCSPTDHTMSKSVYLTDPDGITIEFTLETPKRFKRVVINGSLGVEDVNGNIHAAADGLDVDEVLKHLPDTDITKTISNGSKIGHIHLYATDVVASDRFYKQLGFTQFNFLPEYRYADVGAGGAYQHRVAMNAWHGSNKPMAPEGVAGMRHYQIVFSTKELLSKALASGVSYNEIEGDYWVTDPTGNRIVLTHK